MSHLSTVIFRVENRIAIVYGGDVDAASKDSLWLQSVRNLKEYQEAWTDQTPEEVKKADELYEQFKNYLK